MTPSMDAYSLQEQRYYISSRSWNDGGLGLGLGWKGWPNKKNNKVSSDEISSWSKKLSKSRLTDPNEKR